MGFVVSTRQRKTEKLKNLKKEVESTITGHAFHF